jgi:hypothetical protein
VPRGHYELELDGFRWGGASTELADERREADPVGMIEQIPTKAENVNSFDSRHREAELEGKTQPLIFHRPFMKSLA